MKRTAIVVSHTHWDREWYLPFQEFRMRLVDTVDAVLNLLGSDRKFRHFMLDGQTVILDDYLEVTPERKTELARRVREGRIAIGPWYTLADEFLVSGEALIRNLMAGERSADAIGPVMPIAYIPDTFGHINQMPQIARGWGLKAVLITRGVPDAPCEFLWDAPDGTSLLVINLRLSYGNAAYFQPGDGLPSRVRKLVDDLTPHATTPYLLFMNGMDHAGPDENLPRSIQQVNATLNDVELVHGSLEQFVDAVITNQPQLEHRTGEMRDHEMHFLLPGVLSSRMWVKQDNCACQRLLERWAEPFSAWASVLGAPDRRPLLRQAWRYLLQNHAHDSICGCSVDPVYEDMKRRFVWVDQVANRIVADSLSTIATHALSDSVEQDSLLAVFNSESGPRTDVVETTIESPLSRGGFALQDEQGSHSVPVEILSRDRQTPFSFVADSRVVRLLMGELTQAKLVDKCILDMSLRKDGPSVFLDFDVASAGRPPEAKLASFLTRVKRLTDSAEPLTFYFRMRYRPTVRIRFVADSVPALGYKVWRLAAPARTVKTPRTTQRYQVDNEYFTVSADPQDGTLALRDKASSRAFTGLNSFCDGGDAGDEYNYCPPPGDDLFVTAPSARPRISVDRSQVAQTLRIRTSLRVPAALTADRRARSARMVSLPIETTVRLYPRVRRVDIETRVDNRARDHRLRVHFPTGIRAAAAWADSAFDVLSRSVNAPSSGKNLRENPSATGPLQRFVDVHDQAGGLTVATDGLPEYEVLDGDHNATIAITLLRCVGWLSRGDLSTRQGNAGPAVATPGAQCLGAQRFRYSVIPHEGGWENALASAHAFASPMRAVVAWGGLPRAATGSLLSVDPEAVLISTVKAPEAGEGLVVRLYNPLVRAVRARMRVGPSFTRATRVNLREDPVAEGGASPELVFERPGLLELDLPAKRIQTILLHHRNER